MSDAYNNVHAALDMHKARNKEQGTNLKSMLVSVTKVEMLLAETLALRARIKEAEVLMKRRPKATNSMFVGGDNTSWGKQASAWLNQKDKP